LKVGVILPHFSDVATPALDAAKRAESLGLDGVFVYDHIWPMGRPDRPALSAFPLLGAVAAVTRTIWFGSLVARVGLLAEQKLISSFVSLEQMAPARVIAGLGTGDSMSTAENQAYGIAVEPVGKRRQILKRCCFELRSKGIPVWIGAGAAPTSKVAGECGAALNVWQAQPSNVRDLAAFSEVTWAGRIPGMDQGALGAGAAKALGHLESLAMAGATWAVSTWPGTAGLQVLAGARLSL